MIFERCRLGLNLLRVTTAIRDFYARSTDLLIPTWVRWLDG